MSNKKLYIFLLVHSFANSQSEPVSHNQSIPNSVAGICLSVTIKRSGNVFLDLKTSFKLLLALMAIKTRTAHLMASDSWVSLFLPVTVCVFSHNPKMYMCQQPHQGASWTAAVLPVAVYHQTHTHTHVCTCLHTQTHAGTLVSLNLPVIQILCHIIWATGQPCQK